MPIIVQQDATKYSLFISVNRSACFGLYLHPSSGAHVTVSTAAVSVQSRSRQVAVTVLLMPDVVDKVTWAPDGGGRCQPKHVERFTDINKLYIVASCWAIIGIYFTMHGPLNVKFIEAKQAKDNKCVLRNRFKFFLISEIRFFLEFNVRFHAS